MLGALSDAGSLPTHVPAAVCVLKGGRLPPPQSETLVDFTWARQSKVPSARGVLGLACSSTIGAGR
jgi:hypothetical protein